MLEYGSLSTYTGWASGDGFLKAFEELFAKRVSNEQWRQIYPSIARENCKSIEVVSLAIMTALVVMLLVSFINEQARGNLALYAMALASVLAIYLVTRHTSPANEKAIGFLMYLLISLCLVYAAMLGTVFNPNQNACTFPAFILAVSVFFTDKFTRMIVCIAIHTFFFVCMTLLFVDPAFVASDIINSCVFAAAGIFVSFHQFGVKTQRAIAELRLAELSEKDLLTGVKNRNSFELALDGYPDKCQQALGCVYLDLNGLHELNDSKGHASGDAMLKYVGAALREELGEENTYRIGGDEFVAFVLDPNEGELERRAAAISRMVEEASYHVSIGVARDLQPKIDMKSLLKRAELAMYDSKRRYYQQEGIDRRRRPEAAPQG